MSTDTERNRSSAISRAKSAASGKGIVSSANFESRWFYVYRVREHGAPAQCYRLKWRKTAYANVAAELPAIAEDVSERPSFGTALGDITFRHKGYVVILLVHEKEKIDDVTFTFPNTTTKYESFTDGKVVDAVGGNTDLSAFYCINHMLSKNGQELGKAEAQGFIVSVEHGNRLVEGEEGPRGHEDAGTNLGPPKT